MTLPTRTQPNAQPRRTGEVAPHSPRVCLLSDTFAPVVGGGETQARLLAGRLKARGVDIFVVSRRITYDMPRAEVVDEIPVSRIGPAGFSRMSKYLMMLPAFVTLVTRRRAYDLIYVCGFRTLGMVAVLAGKLLRKPTVLKAESEGEFSGSFLRDNERVRTRRLLAWLGEGYLRIRNSFLRRADQFVSISGPIRDEFIRHGVPASAVLDIPNGVDLDRFKPVSIEEKRAIRDRLGLPLERVIVAYSGKLNKGKGLELLLRVWGEAVAKHPRALLLVVGSGAGQYLSCEEELRQAVREGQLSDSVQFTGFVDEVPAYLQAADIYVFPSEREGLPLGLLEAMACGLPVVATRVGAIPSVVEDGVSGLLVPPGVAEPLREALLQVLSDPRLRKQLGEAAQVRARQFGIEQVVDRYQEVFQMIGCRNGSARPQGAG